MPVVKGAKWNICSTDELLSSVPLPTACQKAATSAGARAPLPMVKPLRQEKHLGARQGHPERNRCPTYGSPQGSIFPNQDKRGASNTRLGRALRGRGPRAGPRDSCVPCYARLRNQRACTLTCPQQTRKRPPRAAREVRVVAVVRRPACRAAREVQWPTLARGGACGKARRDHDAPR